MKINLIKNEELKSQTIYELFLNNAFDTEKDIFTDEFIELENTPDFPIYLGRVRDDEKLNKFKAAIKVIIENYIKVDRDIHLNEQFWYTLFLTEKRNYLIKEYPTILESERDFNNIVMKNFDWENYVYKCVLAAEYLNSNNIPEDEIDYYIELIHENLDVYNYLIKSKLFRISDFVLRFLKIIDDNNLTNLMKAKIKNRPELGSDQRYGRIVLFELKNMYPNLLVPLLTDEEITQLIKDIVSKYQ